MALTPIGKEIADLDVARQLTSGVVVTIFPDGAEKYLNDAAQILPRDATVHEHLGDVLAKRGDTTRALSLYRVALTLDPESKDEAKLRSKIAELEKQQQAQQTPR